MIVIISGTAITIDCHYYQSYCSVGFRLNPEGTENTTLRKEMISGKFRRYPGVRNRWAWNVPSCAPRLAGASTVHRSAHHGRIMLPRQKSE